MRKRKYRNSRKKAPGKLYIRKNKVYFGERRLYLRKNKVYLGEVEKEVKEETVYLEQFFRQHYL